MSEFDDLMRQKAVALKYSPEKNGAPVIVASGMGYMAEKITETALQAGVPVYEDDSLATLLTQLKLGAEIPRELYQAIVEIYIYFLGYVPGQKENEEEPSEEAEAREGGEPSDSSEEKKAPEEAGELGVQGQSLRTAGRPRSQGSPGGKPRPAGPGRPHSTAARTGEPVSHENGRRRQ